MTETLSVHARELNVALNDLHRKGAIVLTFSDAGETHFPVTFQRNNFSAIPPKANEEMNER